jgi:hypothetical protein
MEETPVGGPKDIPLLPLTPQDQSPSAGKPYVPGLPFLLPPRTPLGLPQVQSAAIAGSEAHPVPVLPPQGIAQGVKEVDKPSKPETFDTALAKLQKLEESLQESALQLCGPPDERKLADKALDKLSRDFLQGVQTAISLCTTKDQVEKLQQYFSHVLSTYPYPFGKQERAARVSAVQSQLNKLAGLFQRYADSREALTSMGPVRNIPLGQKVVFDEKGVVRGEPRTWWQKHIVENWSVANRREARRTCDFMIQGLVLAKAHGSPGLFDQMAIALAGNTWFQKVLSRNPDLQAKYNRAFEGGPDSVIKELKQSSDELEAGCSHLYTAEELQAKRTETLKLVKIANDLLANPYFSERTYDSARIVGAARSAVASLRVMERRAQDSPPEVYSDEYNEAKAMLDQMQGLLRNRALVGLERAADLAESSQFSSSDLSTFTGVDERPAPGKEMNDKAQFWSQVMQNLHLFSAQKDLSPEHRAGCEGLLKRFERSPSFKRDIEGGRLHFFQEPFQAIERAFSSTSATEELPENPRSFSDKLPDDVRARCQTGVMGRTYSLPAFGTEVQKLEEKKAKRIETLTKKIKANEEKISKLQGKKTQLASQEPKPMDQIRDIEAEIAKIRDQIAEDDTDLKEARKVSDLRWEWDDASRRDQTIPRPDVITVATDPAIAERMVWGKKPLALAAKYEETSEKARVSPKDRSLTSYRSLQRPDRVTNGEAATYGREVVSWKRMDTASVTYYSTDRDDRGFRSVPVRSQGGDQGFQSLFISDASALDYELPGMSEVGALFKLWGKPRKCERFPAGYQRPTDEEMEDPEVRTQYDEMVVSDYLARNGVKKLPSVEEARATGNVFTAQQVRDKLVEISKSENPVQAFQEYCKSGYIETPTGVFPLQVLLIQARSTIQAEYELASHCAPPGGIVYAMDPPSIFAAQIGGNTSPAANVNELMQAFVLKETIDQQRRLYHSCPIAALAPNPCFCDGLTDVYGNLFNSQGDPAIVPKDRIITRDGLKTRPKDVHGNEVDLSQCALRRDSCGDCFGQNEIYEGASTSAHPAVYAGTNIRLATKDRETRLSFPVDRYGPDVSEASYF